VTAAELKADRAGDDLVAPPSPRARCRFCGHGLTHNFVDLGMSPLCESFVGGEQLNHMEPFYPLHAYVCEKCWLVQLEEFVTPGDIFSEYAYFSSYSDSWVEHAKRYVQAMCDRFGLGARSKVIEIASNDGYLLQHFVARGVPVLGVEPAANVAKVAVERGVPSTVRFFGQKTARELVAEHGKPDLLLGNNVLAHVPDLNDFVGGMKTLLKADGIITMEFPHLDRLMRENQFDTIYHEHFSYFSFITVERVFAAHGLTLFDVEELPTHGGSLRIYARHADDHSKETSPQVPELRSRELAHRYDRLETYAAFEEQVKETKRRILSLLIDIKRSGKSIAGYGAPGKGNTLLNYCGIRQDFLDFTVDRNPYKHGKYTPGTHIPIFDPREIDARKPDFIFLLPWNLRQEIIAQLAHVRTWGAKFIMPIPQPTIVD
jgi:SAM-dependent methyltransferase